MRSLFITLCYASFFGVGVIAPFVLTLGYVWVNSFIPQAVVYSLLNQLPISLFIGTAAIAGYVLLDRRDPPRLCFITVLLVLFAAWVTLSTFAWAVVPNTSVEKWNRVVKTLLFTAFIPLVIRSRIQIEAFLQIWLFGFAVSFLPPGLKALIAGGGYGRDLGIHGSAFADDARLAMIALMLVPIMLFLRKHTKILPAHWLTGAMYLTMIVIAFGAAYGTYERTGLIVGAVLAALLWLKSQRKLLLGAALAAAVPLGIHLMPTEWLDRMGTIESTANGENDRVIVWEWSFNYAVEHPLGGGFQIYRDRSIGRSKSRRKQIGLGVP